MSRARGSPGSDRGQGETARLAKIGVAVVIGLAAGAIVASILVPVALGEIVDDDTYTETQDTGEVVNITTNIDSTLDATNTTAATDNVNVTLTDTANNDTVAHTQIDNGTTQDFALSGGTVTVGVEDVAASSATLNYTVPNDFAWSGGASAMWNILDVVITLAVMLLFIGMALAAVNRV